ncbi:MAG TPA: phosphatidylglycerophosphatase A [Gammaproteobacteria bacterium]|nr:phosphatidylglycerophosphatase A [Gammaproteobacteria bacterium]
MTDRNTLPTWIWRRPDCVIACGFGTGAAPYAPGTFGTLVALPLYWFMQFLSAPVYLALCLLLFIAGVWVCDRTAKLLKVHDHPGIVWDEVVGFLITMFMAPTGWVWWVIGFLLFRLFDIVKPWPIRLLDRQVGGGFGIMVDDGLAGIFAAISLQIIAASNLF